MNTQARPKVTKLAWAASLLSAALLCACQPGGLAPSGSSGGARISGVKTIPKNPMEEKVLRQARVVGTAVGAGAGAGAGYAIGRNNENIDTRVATYTGAAIGAIGGAIAGNFVGKRQIRDLRIRQLTVDETADLARGARAYNQQVATQISTLRSQVAKLDTETKNKRSLVRSIARSYDNVDTTILRQEKLLEGATGSRKSQYRSEIQKLRTKRDQLKSLLEEAKRKSGATIVS